MKYCIKCLMTDTRPGITFEDRVCAACINYEKQKTIDWDQRRKELEDTARSKSADRGISRPDFDLIEEVLVALCFFHLVEEE